MTTAAAGAAGSVAAAIPSTIAPLFKKIRDDPGGAYVITDLDLSNMGITPNDVRLLTNAMVDHLKYTGEASFLRNLDLSGNRVCGVDLRGGTEFDMMGLAELMKVIKVSKANVKLNTLNLFRNPIPLEGSICIGDMLSTNSTLSTLNLSKCSICAEGMSKIMEGLAKNQILSNLILYGNRFGDEGATCIAEAMNENAKLKALDIGDTNLSDSGIAKMFSTFNINLYLQVLILSENRIGDEGAAVIGTFLKSGFYKINHLDLQGNLITSRGASSLAFGLRRNVGLVFLGLQWNQIGDEGAESLGKALTINRALKAIYLLGNEISPSGAQLLIEGSLTNDETPIQIDIPYLPARPRDKRIAPLKPSDEEND